MFEMFLGLIYETKSFRFAVGMLTMRIVAFSRILDGT